MTTALRRPPNEQHIRAMFDAIVEPYDVLNRVISLGLDRAWRRRALGSLPSARGAPVLDLGCGTGEFAHLLGEGRNRIGLGDSRSLVGLDLSARMLRRARSRLGPSALLVQASAFRLPFADSTFAAAVSGFVLRNLDDLPAAFAELCRVLQPGARIALLDAAEPSNVLLRQVFNLYFGTVAPAAGALVGHARAYQYLARSLVQLPGPQELIQLLSSVGFESCRSAGLALGAVVLITARKKGAA